MNHNEKRSILVEANEITGENLRGYEEPEVAFSKIAKITSAITGKNFTPKDVVFFFMAVKLQREAFKHKRDNLIDIAGYADLLNKLEEKDATNDN